MTGRFNYFDNTRSNAPTAILYTNDKTNAPGYELHGYAMAKYSVVNANRFSLQIGAGAGFFNQRLQYPFRDDSGAGSIYLTDSSFTDLAFPVSVEFYYLLRNWVSIGVKAGGFIEPDFPIVGAHVGPQLRLRL
ncbi:hypothetical protein [Spirosoma areae]